MPWLILLQNKGGEMIFESLGYVLMYFLIKGSNIGNVFERQE
jgi:hypothetical protein